MRRFVRTHYPLVGYLILSFGIVLGFYFLNQSRSSLCALRTDLDQRIVGQRKSIRQGGAFLKSHPHGAFGFTRKEIQISISGQQRTLENSLRTRQALGSLWCGKRTI